MATGRVGVGTGARWGAINGPANARDGAFAAAQIDVSGGTVTAVAVVNAFGVLASEEDPRPAALERDTIAPFGQSTTLMSVVIDIPCDHQTLTRLCVAAHDALVRVIRPAHTHVDGDVAFASTTVEGQLPAGTLLPLIIATELAMEEALRRAAGGVQ
jgi:L-aminopeptidase/D-esterase-like protein